MPASARRAPSTRARGSSRGVAERATTTRAASSEKARARDAPTTTHYEFGGPIGALAITVALPLVCYFLAYACNEDGCAEVSKLARGGAFPGFPKHMPLWSVDGAVDAPQRHVLREPRERAASRELRNLRAPILVARVREKVAHQRQRDRDRERADRSAELVVRRRRRVARASLFG